MGSITKLQRIDKKTGNPVTVFRAYVRRKGYASKSKVCSTKPEAKEWIRENDATVTLKKITSGKSFAQMVEEFIEAPPTKGTKFWAAPHLEFWKSELGTMKVTDISRGDINSAKSKLLSQTAMRSTPSGPIPTSAKLTAATINRYLASLSSVFNFAMDRELIDAHPMKGGKVKKLKENGGRTRILNDDEEGRLYEAARRSDWPMLYLLVRMALTTAARRGELLNLRWSDVRLEDSIAVLSKTKNDQARALPLVIARSIWKQPTAQVRLPSTASGGDRSSSRTCA
jgi:integrase